MSSLVFPMQSVFWKDNNNTDYYFRILDSRNGVLDSRHLEDKEIDIVDPTAGSNQSDSEVLKNTFMIYGTILVVSFLLFCFVRQRFPRPYSIRNWVQKVKSPLAENKYGFFSWMWKMNAATDDEILDECGMDSLCFLRLLSMGYRISCISALNAIWLLPLYKFTESDEITEKITDPIAQLTIGHVPAGSPRLVGTVIAAYILFGYMMYLILQEFTWFIEFRHKYLRKSKPRNYTIYVRNIPPEYRSNSGLEKFFKQCFSADSILEAKLRIKAPQLIKAVDGRELIINKLDHALAYEEMYRQPFMIRPNVLGGNKVRAIPYLFKELNASNSNITQRIEDISQRSSGKFVADIPVENIASNTNQNTGDFSLLEESDFNVMDTLDETEKLQEGNSTDEGEISQRRLFNKTFKTLSSHATKGAKVVSSHSKLVTAGATMVTAGASNLATSAVSLLKGIDEGEYYDSGFVTFTNLCTTNAALQMVHHEKPFAIAVQQAPDPEDIFWNNVGRSQKDIQIGNLISKCGTVAVCLFWTIPMTIVSSFASVDGLKKVEFIGKIIEAVPILEPILLQLAPLFIIMVNSLLPMILTFFSMREGPVSTSVVEASLFTKLAAFSIIQTFFVTFLGGAILEDITEMVKDYSLIFDLLGKTLPSKSTFFIQIIFVSNAISLTLEILQVVPIAMAIIRSFLSPRLTEQERSTTVFGIRPLADPSEFSQASNLACVVLNFMVMLVYAIIAPLTAFILGFCFSFMHVCYKHQFFYIYPTLPDSGGKIWADFIKILMSCMLISQVTIFALMGLKQATIAGPLMIPLIIVTVLFNGYVRQQHFLVSSLLPSRQCLKTDLQNGPDFDLHFLKDAYLQDELRYKIKDVEVTPMQRIALEREGLFINPENKIE